MTAWIYERPIGPMPEEKIGIKSIIKRVLINNLSLLSYDNRGSETNFQNWIFSFQRSI